MQRVLYSCMTIAVLVAASACQTQADTARTEKDFGGRRDRSGRAVKRYSATDRDAARAKSLAANSMWSGPSPVRFVEESRERGIDFVQWNGRSDQRFYVEIVGSGAIFFDAERDGDPDLYLLNQTNVEGAPPEGDPHSTLWINDGSGRFSPAPESSGLTDRHYSIGVCGGDIDNDGDTDLYVTRFGAPHALYRNDGNLHFTDIVETAGIGGDAFTPASCAFGDIDNDGWLDLYVTTYVKANREINPPCWMKLKDSTERVREYCGPGKYETLPSRMFRNRGEGTFEDVSESSGINAARGNALGVGFADFDRDGDQDLYVACDRTPSLFYQNDGTGHFEESGMRMGVALSNDGVREAGMGTAWGDYDNDGWLDLLKTNYEYENNNLHRNLLGKGFTDMAHKAGMAAPSYSYLAWGTDFLDADNDGDLDVVAVNGHLRKDDGRYEAQSGGILEGYEQINQFFLQTEPGKYVSMAAAAGPGLEIRKVSRGLAIADIDADGDLDFVVTNQHERPDLLVNQSPHPGHWLRVDCRGTRSNRSAIGALLEVVADGRREIREIRSGQGYLGQNELVAHFGLGHATRVESLTIRWPSGAVETLRDLPADRLVQVVEGAGLLQP